MSCSILYAYVRSMSPPKNAFTPLYVPITNIPAADIQLRPEYLAVFRHADIEPGHLITLDDLPPLSDIQTKLVPENTQWVLVDHNALQGRLGKIYSERVAGVIDHHDDEGKVRKDTGDEPRIIEKSGSCTSLIANYCRPTWDMLSASALSSGAAHAQGDSMSDDAAVVKRWDAGVAQLGLASILIDTADLNDKNKTTEHDRMAVEYLEAKIMLCPQLSASFDRTSFYQEIDAARRDIGTLKLQDILRKDYKQWDQSGLQLGISSVVKNIDFLQEKAGDEANMQSPDHAFLGALEEFAKARELDLYTLMTTSTSAEGKFQREILLWAFNDRGVTAAEAFATKSSEELGLEDWHGSGNVGDAYHGKGQWRRVWWQRQVQHSRKRVAPLLREAMA
jgi:exopolyphosphatase